MTVFIIALKLSFILFSYDKLSKDTDKSYIYIVNQLNKTISYVFVLVISDVELITRWPHSKCLVTLRWQISDSETKIVWGHILVQVLKSSQHLIKSWHSRYHQVLCFICKALKVQIDSILPTTWVKLHGNMCQMNDCQIDVILFPMVNQICITFITLSHFSQLIFNSL